MGAWACVGVTITPKEKNCKPGTAKGQILHVAIDFDELPSDFKEYVATPSPHTAETTPQPL